MMVDRPSDFDITTPTGADSPRSGDDELRKIKKYTQNSYNDLVEETGVGVTHSTVFGTIITADTRFEGDLTGNVIGDTTGAHNGSVGATNTNTGAFTTIVASGDITGDLVGNADTASALETARNITLSGDGSGNVSFDGSDDVTLDLNVNSVQPNSVALSSDTTGNYVETITGTADEITVAGSGSEGADVVISLPSTINADTTGNASTATTLGTARDIGGVSFDGSSDITLPGVDAEGNQDTTGSAATLTTSRNIGGVAFDGSANISLPGVNTTGNQNTSGSAASLTTSRNIGGVAFNGSSDINLPGVNAAGNQDTTGNASTATTWQTARTINLTANSNSGGVTGTLAGVDGSGNITIETTLVGDVADGVIATANALTNARNFDITGEVNATAATFNGTADVDLAVTIADNIVDEANLRISNAGSNGQFLSKQSGNTGGLTWATVTTPDVTLSSLGVSASAAELNFVDGVTSNVQTQLGNKANSSQVLTNVPLNAVFTDTQATLSSLGVTASATELNTIDGFTGSTADLNYAKDLNATGVTTTEFDKLDGLTPSTTELNFVDGVTSAIQTQLDSKTGTADNTFTGTTNVAGAFQLAGSTVSSTAADINKLNGLLTSQAELNFVDGVTSAIQTQFDDKQNVLNSSNRLNANLVGSGNVSDTEYNFLNGVTSAVQTQLTGKAPLASPTFTGTANISGTFQLGGTSVTSTAAELNILDGVTATTAELNTLDLASDTQLGIVKLETDSGNADPVIGDFTGNVTMIAQY